MDNISEPAEDLLQALKRIKKIKRGAVEYIDKRRVLIDYGYDQNGKELDPLFDELREKGYIKKESGAYRLLAKALNQAPGLNHSVNVFSGTFTQANIANNSPNAMQSIDLRSYSAEIQMEVENLQEAIAAKDDTRAKRIIDGLWVSAPQLVLGLIQIGLTSKGVVPR